MMAIKLPKGPTHLPEQTLIPIEGEVMGNLVGKIKTMVYGDGLKGLSFETDVDYANQTKKMALTFPAMKAVSTIPYSTLEFETSTDIAEVMAAHIMTVFKNEFEAELAKVIEAYLASVG